MKRNHFAANAVYAKVKCLYGKRLTDKNYRELLERHGVNDVAEYLKSKTAYSEIFDGLNATNELQRSQLENLLFNKMYNEFESVIRFQKAAGSDLYQYFIIKFDTVQIINVLSSLETRSDTYFFTFPIFYNERSRLDLYKLAQAKSEGDLLQAAEKTIYYDTLRSALTKYRLTKNLTVVQSEFQNFIDGEIVKLLTGSPKKKLSDKNELGKLYKTMKDVRLIQILYRMLRFDSVTPDGIGEPLLTNFTKQQISQLFQAKTKQELTAAVSATYLAEIAGQQESGDIFQRADNYLCKIFQNAVMRSHDPGKVMFAYFCLAEIEIKNIIHIIEGIRYGLSPLEIMPMLNGVSLSQ